MNCRGEPAGELTRLLPRSFASLKDCWRETSASGMSLCGQPNGAASRAARPPSQGGVSTQRGMRAIPVSLRMPLRSCATLEARTSWGLSMSMRAILGRPPGPIRDVAGACRSCDAGASPLRTFSPLEFPLDLRSRIADPFDGGSDFGRGRAGFLGLVARLVPLSAGYLGAVLRAAAFRSR